MLIHFLLLSTKFPPHNFFTLCFYFSGLTSQSNQSLITTKSSKVKVRATKLYKEGYSPRERSHTVSAFGPTSSHFGRHNLSLTQTCRRRARSGKFWRHRRRATRPEEDWCSVTWHGSPRDTAISFRCAPYITLLCDVKSTSVTWP